MEQGNAAGYAGLGQKITLPTVDRPLDGIADNAKRIERLAYTVEQFTDRFYSGPCETAGASACREVPLGYHGQLARLTEATDRLDKAIHRLSEIG